MTKKPGLIRGEFLIYRLATLSCSRIIGGNSRQQHKTMIGDNYG
jgi:hypothetical protein